MMLTVGVENCCLEFGTSVLAFAAVLSAGNCFAPGAKVSGSPRGII